MLHFTRRRKLWPRAMGAALLAVCGCTNTSNNAAPSGAGGTMGSAGSASVDAAAGHAGMDGGADAPTSDAAVAQLPYLWFAGSALNAFSQNQTETSNDRGPRFVFVPTFSVTSFHDLVFDHDGNLWALPISGDQIVRLPADQLVSGAPPTPDVVITSGGLKSPTSLAFDQGGNLWVMNFAGAGPQTSIASIVRFDDARTGTGYRTLTPAATIGPGPLASNMAHFSQGTAIAFDQAGSLWFAGVSSVLRIDSPSTLHGDVVAAPTAIISTTTEAFASIAFDATGALWITGAGNGYFVSRIANPGALSGSLNPMPAAKLHLPGGAALFASGMAFDADGALWISMSNDILKLAAPGTLTGDVTPTPAVVLGLAGLPDLSSKLVIRPTPSGLPIF